MTTTAKIAAKGTKGTGITEQLAAALHDNLGKTVVAIIELRSESRGENLKGDETVNLAIQNLEVIPEDVGAAEHVRELAKVAHYNRKLTEGGNDAQLQLPGDGPEPKVADVIAEGKKYAPHEFIPTEEDDTTICDVCGDDENDPRHTVITDDQDDDPQPEPDEDEPAVRQPSTVGSPFTGGDAA